jgi:hypothetical protein
MFLQNPLIFISPLTFKRGKSSNFIQTKTEYMRKLILVAYTSFMILLTSCATYRNGHTPDDVYMAAEPEWVSNNDYHRYENQTNVYREHRSVGPQTRDLTRFFCDDPNRLIVLNNQCYCLTSGYAIPFVPARPIQNLPTIQNNPSVISKESNPKTINYGKYASPEYNNGSRLYPKANNQNDTERSYSENNGGSRFFQNSAPSNSSGSSQSGSGTRSGRRN